MSQLTKSALRKLMADCLRNLSEDNKSVQSEQVAKLILKHPKYKSASRISLYLSTKDEISTLKVLRQALEVDKKQCFCPLIGKRRRHTAGPRMRMVEIKSMSEYESLALNEYGIKEADETEVGLSDAKVGELDLILVPGVAFSPDGGRLGHGKGYYDEFLFHCSSHGHSAPYCIGLAFREQIVANTLAQAGQDYKLDEILVS